MAENWEKDLIEKVSLAAVTEQRRARRWGIFFKLLIAIYFFVFLWIALGGKINSAKLESSKHTALIEIDGIIAPGSDANADNIITSLRRAFEDDNTMGVILRINSPGGSPVQSGYIYDEIKRLRDEHPETPVYAVVTDLCASGAYYIAAAADKIFANKASLIGSIGVRMDGFGFTSLMDKIGVERRLLTAGKHKGLLDPFSPVEAKEVEYVETLLNEIHLQFITAVRDGRGSRLKEDDKTFSGLIWSGEQSVENGLIDGLSTSTAVAKDIIGAEELKDFTLEPDLFEKLTDKLGVSIANGLSEIILKQAGSMR